MMKKNQSKKMKQLKYLLLIPVLGSMLFYVSCSETESEEKVLRKELSTMYSQIGSNKMKEFKSENETYLDFYMGTEFPNWKEITYDDLNDFEKVEYDKAISKIKNIENSSKFESKIKLYKGDKGRNIIANILDLPKHKKSRKENITDAQTMNLEELVVPYNIVENTPIHPDCTSMSKLEQKKCFSLMIQKHFAKNFDSKLPKTLGLKPGNKRLFIGFKIDKEGKIVDIKARAPHIDLKEEVIRVMSILPKMIPGKQRGKIIEVKYSIPLTIIVE